MRVCPKCGSRNVHETQLHECTSGVPMRCSKCYHTWCQQTPSTRATVNFNVHVNWAESNVGAQNECEGKTQ